MTTDKRKELIESYINSNQSELKKALKKMTKADMIKLVYTWNDEYGEDWFQILRNIDNQL